MAAREVFTTDNIYFGTVKVEFKKVKGVTKLLTSTNVNKSDESKANAESRRKPLEQLGVEYSHLLVPAPPAFDLDFTTSEIKVICFLLLRNVLP